MKELVAVRHREGRARSRVRLTSRLAMLHQLSVLVHPAFDRDGTMASTVTRGADWEAAHHVQAGTQGRERLANAQARLLRSQIHRPTLCWACVCHFRQMRVETVECCAVRLGSGSQ